MSTSPAIAHQLGLALRDPKWRPVMNVNGAMAALDLDAREIGVLVESRDLRAWNIAVNDEERSGTRDNPNPPRCLRILTASIEHYRATLGSRRFSMSWADMSRLLLPPGLSRPFILGTEIQRSLNCDSDLVLDLIRAKELALIQGTSWKPGPAGSPQVALVSFEDFLKRRLR